MTKDDAKQIAEFIVLFLIVMASACIMAPLIQPWPDITMWAHFGAAAIMILIAKLIAIRFKL